MPVRFFFFFDPQSSLVAPILHAQFRPGPLHYPSRSTRRGGNGGCCPRVLHFGEGARDSAHVAAARRQSDAITAGCCGCAARNTGESAHTIAIASFSFHLGGFFLCFFGLVGGPLFVSVSVCVCVCARGTGPWWNRRRRPSYLGRWSACTRRCSCFLRRRASGKSRLTS